LNDLVEETLGDVDVIGFCTPANEKIGPGDRFINEQLDRFRRAKKVAIVTKTELATPTEVINALQAVSQLREWDEIIPVSALGNQQLDVLTNVLLGLMPNSPQLYPSELTTDESVEARVAELIREAALEGVHDELPHSLAVTIDELAERSDGKMIKIHANIWVERDSQKGILIGHRGSRLRQVGQKARIEIEKIVSKQVYLDLRIRVAADWQRDPKQLGKLGF
jgi:GTP-binding protein Era